MRFGDEKSAIQTECRPNENGEDFAKLRWINMFRTQSPRLIASGDLSGAVDLLHQMSPRHCTSAVTNVARRSAEMGCHSRRQKLDQVGGHVSEVVWNLQTNDLLVLEETPE